jgi:hypothetical protein
VLWGIGDEFVQGKEALIAKPWRGGLQRWQGAAEEQQGRMPVGLRSAAAHKRSMAAASLSA